MASVIVTIKLMPTGPDVDLDKVYDEACKHVRNFVDQKHKDGEIRKQMEEIGFGLKSLKLIFVMDENIGSTEKLEEHLKKVPNVESVETTDVRRAIG